MERDLHPAWIDTMTTKRKYGRRPRGRQRLTAVLFLPFLVMHFAWITPMVEWSCLCVDYGPEFSCCCNCPTCVEERGGFISYCQVSPRDGDGRALAPSAMNNYTDGAAGGKDRTTIDVLRCDCQSRVTGILLELQPLLPSATVVNIFSFLWTSLTLADAKRPPEAIPCQPEVPG
ncbi:hypothetical protein ACFL2Q_08980 [Thermodesulfobacteriota bacterium]